jgi:hypothetical protein
MRRSSSLAFVALYGLAVGCVEISLDDYAPYRSAFIVSSESAEVPVGPDEDRLDGSYIVLGNIELKKREPDGAAKGSQPIRSETNATSSGAGSRR